MLSICLISPNLSKGFYLIDEEDNLHKHVSLYSCVCLIYYSKEYFSSYIVIRRGMNRLDMMITITSLYSVLHYVSIYSRAFLITYSNKYFQSYTVKGYSIQCVPLSIYYFFCIFPVLFQGIYFDLYRCRETYEVDKLNDQYEKDHFGKSIHVAVL